MLFTDAALPVISNAAANCAGWFFAKTFSDVYKNGCDRNSHIERNENRWVKLQGVG